MNETVGISHHGVGFSASASGHYYLHHSHAVVLQLDSIPRAKTISVIAKNTEQANRDCDDYDGEGEYDPKDPPVWVRGGVRRKACKVRYLIHELLS